MLIIGSPGEVEYYLGSLAADQVGNGTWMGRGAAHLGLTGAPTSEQLRQVLHGLDPVTGEPRWASAPRRRRLGHDVALCAPKPLSIIGALGRPDASAAVVAAHDAAVADAFGYLDRRAAWARRGSEGRLAATEGLVAAGFRHYTSRARDPHLHTHVLVANAVQDLDGVWSSLDGRWLYTEARAAGALYQSALRYYASRAGLSLTWERRDGGLGDVVEVPRETVHEFSRRRRQIQAHLAGWSDWAGAEPSRRANRVAQLATRPPKHGDAEVTNAGPDSWSARARRTGFDAASITVSTPTLPHSTRLDAAAVGDLLGSEGLTARSSHFTRSNLVRAVAYRLEAGAPVADIEAEVERLLTSPAIVRVTPDAAPVGRPRSTPRYTTPEVAGLDERVLAEVTTSTWANTPAVVNHVHLASRPSLGPGQAAAVIDIVSSPFTVTVLRARAELERNAVIEAARAAWETAGTTVLALTPSRGAAAALEAATGIEAVAIADADADAAAAGVVVVDGADRLGSRVLADLIGRAKASGQRVVLIDHERRPAALEGRELLSRLHCAVGGPGPLIEEIPGPPSRSTPPARVAQFVRSGGTVTFTADPDSQRQAMVDDWSRGSAGTGRMVAATRAEMDDLNRRARQRLIADGRIDGPAVNAGGREYRAGEPVVVRRSAPALRLVAGQVGTVSAIDAERRTITIDFAGRRRPVVLAAGSVGRTVLAHAYALPPRRRALGAADTFMLGSSGRGPPSDDQHVYLVAGGRPGRSPLSGDRLTRLACANGGHANALHSDTAHALHSEAAHALDAGLGQLESARSALAADLLAAMPADVTGALISAREERAAAAHWALAPEASATARQRRDAAERAVAQLEVQATDFESWTNRRRPDLDRLARLDRAIEDRRHLLGRAAEALPGPELTAALGPPRQPGNKCRSWREGAAAFEAYRERWGIAPQTIEPVPLDPLQRRHRDDLLRLIARVQDPLSREREHRREVGIVLR